MRSRFFLRLSGSLLLLLMPTSGWAADYPIVVRGRAENGGGPRLGFWKAAPPNSLRSSVARRFLGDAPMRLLLLLAQRERAHLFDKQLKAVEAAQNRQPRVCFETQEVRYVGPAGRACPPKST